MNISSRARELLQTNNQFYKQKEEQQLLCVAVIITTNMEGIDQTRDVVYKILHVILVDIPR